MRILVAPSVCAYVYTHIPTCSVRPVLPKYERKKTTNFPYCINAEVLYQILANQIQQYVNRIINYDQMGSFPGM